MLFGSSESQKKTQIGTTALVDVDYSHFSCKFHLERCKTLTSDFVSLHFTAKEQNKLIKENGEFYLLHIESQLNYISVLFFVQFSFEKW